MHAPLAQLPVLCILLTFLKPTFSFFLVPKECFGYRLLSDAWRMTSHGKGNNCDKNLTDVWYRFVPPAGVKMPTSCVQKHHCGTYSPVWMNGTHPTHSDGIVSRRVCGSFWRRLLSVQTHYKSTTMSGIVLRLQIRTPRILLLGVLWHNLVSLNLSFFSFLFVFEKKWSRWRREW